MKVDIIFDVEPLKMFIYHAKFNNNDIVDHLIAFYNLKWFNITLKFLTV